MRERTIEGHLKARTEAAGGVCLKVVAIGWAGFPDRVILLPQARIAFVEVKRPGSRPRPLQETRIQALQRFGFVATWVDSYEGVDRVLAGLLAPAAMGFENREGRERGS